MPPIGLAYVAAAVQNAGYITQVIDAIGSAIHKYTRVDKDPQTLHYGLTVLEIVDRIHPDTDVVGISILFSREWLMCREVITAIRVRFPNIKIIAGGEHITACAEYSLQNCPAIDVAVVGEGEETILELLKSLIANEPLRTVAGIVFRENNHCVRTPPRKRIKHIDAIQEPAWELFPLNEYISSSSSVGFDLGRSAPLLASRGCPFRCTFCSNPLMWGTTWVARTPELVIAEMKAHMERYKVTNFDFYDLTAIVKKEWIVDFCKLILAEKMEITWQLPSGTRSEALDSETLDWLYRSGCRSIVYAPESGSKEELARIKKKVIPERMLESMHACYKKGIRTKANIIFGLPGSTYKDVFFTLIFIVRMAWVGVNDVGCFSFSPYPGSELAEDLLKNNKITYNDEYFYNLSRFSNFLKTTSYHEHFSGFQLGVFNFTGMSLFYGSSILFRPKRLLDLLRAVFFADSMKSSLARSLSNLRKRKIAQKRLAQGSSNTIELVDVK
ncbi:MAG: B12-binding domain-containing radical SAM protein [Bdellovibrionaceae bacterium]|nr:B12-binding domain-containing radical SAM protein [Pseudobdellovibrionaceae bacterium]